MMPHPHHVLPPPPPPRPAYDAFSKGMYDRLAARLYVSAAFVKATLYRMAYSGAVDPWIRHLFQTEMAALCVEDIHFKRARI